MDFELVPIQFNKIMQAPSYTVFILGTSDKQFAIYTAPHVGQNIQIQLSGEAKPRPYTYDLMNSVFQELDIQILQVVITDVQDTIYFARLFLKQTHEEGEKILEIDARPSDCLALALERDIPIFCSKDVFEKVIAIKGYS